MGEWRKHIFVSHELFQELRWTDSSQITLTMWNNPHLVETEGTRQIGKLSGLHLLPWILPTVMNSRQPLCVVLYMISLHEFFWVNMSCKEPAPGLFPKWKYICEIKHLQTTKQVSVGIQTKCNNTRSIFVFPFCLSWGEIWNFPERDQRLRRFDKSRFTGNLTSVLSQLLENHYLHILLSKFFQHSIFVLAKYEQNNRKFFQPILLLKTNYLLYLDVHKWKTVYQSDIDIKEMIHTPIFALNVSDSRRISNAILGHLHAEMASA